MNDPAAAVAWAEAEYDRIVDAWHRVQDINHRMRKLVRSTSNPSDPAWRAELDDLRAVKHALYRELEPLLGVDRGVRRPMFEIITEPRDTTGWERGDVAAHWPAPKEDDELIR